MKLHALSGARQLWFHNTDPVTRLKLVPSFVIWWDTDDTLVLFDGEFRSISLDKSHIGVTITGFPRNPMLIHEVTSHDFMIKVLLFHQRLHYIFV